MRTTFGRWALIAVVGGLVGCGDAPSAPVSTRTPSEQVLAEAPNLAREFAATLADESARRTVRTLLRSSTQRQFAADPLPLLAGRGALAESLKGQYGSARADDLADDLAALADFEIVMPSRFQRRRWTPDQPLWVAFAPPTMNLTTELVAFGPDGTTRLVAVTGVPQVNLLVLRPARSLSVARLRSPLEDPGRETVEDPDVPLIMLIEDDCTPEVSQPGLLSSDCDPPGGPCIECDDWSIEPDVLCTPITAFDATLFTDVDRDGVRDYCEEHLARTFEPLLQFQSGEFWSIREPKFAAIPSVAGIAIMYLLSYYEDGGIGLGVGAHNGDSEFVIVELKPDGPNWRPLRVFTSAHYGGIWEQSKWNDISDFPVSEAPHPFIFASKGKHANYVSRTDCLVSGDSCGFGGYPHWAMVGWWINIGSLSYPFDIDPTLSVGGDDCSLSSGGGIVMECYRTSGDFRGWQTGSSSSTAYKHHLNDWGF